MSRKLYVLVRNPEATQTAAAELLDLPLTHFMRHDIALSLQASRLAADAMAKVRSACDALEVAIDDECWPLPKYREMLFPV